MTPLELIQDLWSASQPGRRCPHVAFEDGACRCRLLEGPAGRMVCDHFSLQLWCLTADRYPKCSVYREHAAAGPVSHP